MYALAKILLARKSARSTLWLLDGFEEHGVDGMAARVGLAGRGGLDDATKRAWAPIKALDVPPVEALLGVLLAQPRVVLTTSRHFCEQLGATQYYELLPLAHAQVASFMELALNGDQKALGRLRQKIAASPVLADAVRVPAIMQMAIIRESTIKADATSPEPSCFVASLYEGLLCDMRDRFFEHWIRLPVESKRTEDPKRIEDPKRTAADAWAKAKPELQRVALAGCDDDPESSRWSILDPSMLDVLRTSRIVDVSVGGSRVQFAHRSIQEFFAATEVLRMCTGSPTRADRDEALIARALSHASNDALRRFAFGLAPDIGTAAVLLAALGVPDQGVLPSDPILEEVAACLPHFRGLHELPFAATVRAAAAAFWTEVEHGKDWDADIVRRTRDGRSLVECDIIIMNCQQHPPPTPPVPSASLFPAGSAGRLASILGTCDCSLHRR